MNAGTTQTSSALVSRHAHNRSQQMASCVRFTGGQTAVQEDWSQRLTVDIR